MGIFGSVGDAIGGGLGDALGKAAGGVLNVIFPQVNEAVSQFNQQKNVIEDMVRAPIKEMLGEVGGGEIWRGPGAEAFVGEMNQVFLPEADTVSEGIEEISNKVKSAAEIMQAADKKAAGIANELAQQFRDITKTL